MLRKSTIFIIFGLILTSLSVFSQNPFPPVEFNVSSGMDVKGSKVCITVTANNFTNVESIQLNISYNAALVIPDCPGPSSFVGSALAPAIDSTNFNCKNIANGYLNFVWYSAPTSVPDGSVLFTICFTLIGEPGNISPVYFNGQLLDIEIGQVDNDGNSFTTDEIISNTGTIKIISNTLASYVYSCDADQNNVSAGGNFTFYATGGRPPYNYSITPGGYSGTTTLDGERRTINSVPVGVYVLTVTDANGATSTKNIIISTGDPIKFIANVKLPSCQDRRNGSIAIKNLAGGIPPYSYQWSNLLTNLDSIGNLPINTYTVTISDFNGCNYSQSFDLNIDTLKFDMIMKDSASCLGVKDGKITILNVTGGSKFNGANPYKYSINTFGNPKSFIAPFDITTASAGINTVKVIDSLGCIVEKQINIPFKKTVAFDTMVVKDIKCFGQSNGEIRYKAGPGSGYSYTLSPNIPGATLGGVFLVSNLNKGTYIITARDIAGCTAKDTFEIKEPEVLKIVDQISYPDCANFGSIKLTPTGGTGAYTYDWSPSAGNVNELTNLNGGNYSVIVSDANGCKDTKSYTFNNVGTLTLIIDLTHETCENKKDGTAKVVPQFSNTPTPPMFQIIWLDANKNILPFVTPTINNLAPGNYFVQIKTTDGCDSGPKPFQILAANAVTIITNITNAKCNGDLGKVVVSITGNPSGYTYQWNLKGNSNIIDTDNTLDAKAGTYVVKAIGPTGCEKQAEVTITEPIAITFPTPDTRNVKCFGSSDGQAAILNGPSGQQYIWSNGTTGPFITDLPAGEYWVVAFENGCFSDTTHFTIGTYPKLEIDTTKTQVKNPVCFGDKNGSVTIEAKGGTGISYKYAWENGPLNATYNNIGAGTYVINISDSNNCTQKDTFILTQPDKLEASVDNAASVPLDCNNQDAGKIALKTIGGNPGIKTISWQSGVQVNGGIAVGLSAGTYCATISDNFGCKDTICHTLVAPTPLVGELNIPTEPLCNGGQTCISVKSLSGGTGNKYTFQINGGIRYPLDTCVAVYAGEYLVHLIDSTGCSITKSLTIGQPDPIEVNLGPDQEIQLGLPSPIINALITTPTSIDTIIWTPLDYLQCIASDCSSVEVNPVTTTTYTLTAIDINGCKGTDDVVVKVKNIRNVYFANIFSPNKDGENDYFQAVIGPGVERILSFNIFDRWGNLIFSKTNYIPDPAGTDGWDGTRDGLKLDPAVFVYTAKALFIDGKVIDYSGSVTLIDRLKN